MRPMSVGELLDRIFTSYRSHLGLFVGIMLPLAMIQSIVAMIVLLLQNLMVRDLEMSDPDNFATMILVAAVSFGSAVVGFVLNTLAMAVLIVAFSEVHLDRGASIQSAYSLVKGRVSGMLGLSLSLIVIAMVVFIGLVMIVAIPVVVASAVHPLLGFAMGVPIGLGAGLGAVYFLSRLAVAIPSLVLERCGIFESLRRSVLLVKGYEVRAILVYVLALVISYVSMFLFQGPFLLSTVLFSEGGVVPVWILVGQALGGGVGWALTGPLLSIGMALLYFDLRVRKEALDLEMAMLEPAARTVSPQ